MPAKTKKSSTTKSKHHLHAAKKLEATKPLSVSATSATTTVAPKLQLGCCNGTHISKGAL